MKSAIVVAFKLYWDWMLLPVIAIVAWYWPKVGNAFIAPIENFGARLAKRKAALIFGLVLFVVVIRVSLLPFFPIRPAGIQDEFSYLLAGDTFAHGRLTNPPHPMALYLDTFNELFTPTYASMYEPAQGAFLAAGELLGHPWIGVLLSMALMFGALLWMLQGWFPPEWALVGALLPLLRFGILSYWMNTYWGGAVAALGGCLVMGAIPRVIHGTRTRDAIILALGAALVANSRPYEGFLALIPIAAFFIWWLFRERKNWTLRHTRAIAAVLLVGILAGSFMLYYNWRVTRSPLLFPHRLYEERFMSMSIFVWPVQGPLKQYANPQFDVMFNHYSRNQYRRSWPEFERITWDKLKDFATFYLGPAALLSFVALPWLFLDKRMRLFRWQIFFAALATLGAIWFSPHYAAPALAAVCALIVQLFRHLRRWTYRGRAVGIGLTRAAVILALATFIVQGVQVTRTRYAVLPLGWGWWGIWDRETVKNDLKSIPGKHLVIVRYSAAHHFVHREWVYNDADIDDSRIVWAREIPGVSMQPLLDYFHDRKAWLVEPDDAPTRVVPYAPHTTLAATTGPPPAEPSPATNLQAPGGQ